MRRPGDGAPARAALDAWIARHGVNSTAYVLLEGRKRYFVDPGVDGFIGYETRRGIPIIGGDPVCDVPDGGRLLRAFRRAFRPRPAFAYSVRPELLPAFEEAGFGCVQVGAEALIEPARFTLAGGQMEVVRAAVNKARKSGVVAREHDPWSPGAAPVNDELRAISAEWLGTKGANELGFLLGGLGLERQSAKRYFIATRGDGRVDGFIVCEPIRARRGFYLDVTRRRSDAVRGTMELLTAHILETLCAEQCAIASFGLSPLALLEPAGSSPYSKITERLLEAYERIDAPYDFTALYRYKAKYQPHRWERRYLCFTRGAGALLLRATLGWAVWRMSRGSRRDYAASELPHDAQNRASASATGAPQRPHDPLRKRPHSEQ